MLQQASLILSERASTWGANTLNFLPNILAALLILLFFYLLSLLLKKGTFRLSKRFIQKRSLSKFSTSFLQGFIMLIGFLVTLSILNLDKAVTSLLAGAGVAGLIIGFAMQEVISNYLSGVTLSISDHFRTGHLVEIDSRLGVVKQIKSRSTVIESPRGQILEVPNKNVINNTIINFTEKGVRRLEIQGGISYDSDRTKAKKTGLQAVREVPEVNKSLPIEYFFEDLGDSALKFVLRFWINFKNSQKELYAVKSEVIESLLESYEKEGIEMPYPTTTVLLQQRK
ncbi:mechanosensitive ion channel [candidate division WWE3 bacterium]|nr:mechanosensitive ion channel [candidate division WWE3 bacterium]